MDTPRELTEREVLRLKQAENLLIQKCFMLYHLAENHRRAGLYGQAILTVRQCLDLSRELGDDYTIGRAQAVLGQALIARGTREQGFAELEDAYKILSRLEAPESDLVRSLLENQSGV